jgi:hypothetical protein
MSDRDSEKTHDLNLGDDESAGGIPNDDNSPRNLGAPKERDQEKLDNCNYFSQTREKDIDFKYATNELKNFTPIGDKAKAKVIGKKVESQLKVVAEKK